MNGPTDTSGLKPPRSHGQTFIRPELSKIPADLKSNRSAFEQTDVKILTIPLANFRNTTRKELLDIAVGYSEKLNLVENARLPKHSALIVTGHQPQFFHCGVLAKYILANHLAAEHHTTFLNLLVDSDLPKNLSLNLPVTTPNGFILEDIHFPLHDPLLPLEFQPLLNADELQHFLNPLKHSNVPHFLKDRITDIHNALETAHPKASGLCDLLTLVNHHFATLIGLNWIDLPVSKMADSNAFLSFTADILSRGDGFHILYNDLLNDFRTQHRIRNPAHPMPNLTHRPDDPDWLELPLWIFQAGQHRCPLYIRSLPGHVSLSNGTDQSDAISTNPDQIVENLKAALAEKSWSIRPRAVTLSLFVRLFLADTFIHGLGGARYDQVTDKVLKRFYNLTPPAFAVASATMLLPLAKLPPAQQLKDQLIAIQQQQRDLRYNPQRHLSDEETRQLSPLLDDRRREIERSDQLRKNHSPSTQRCKPFESIRQINAQIYQSLPHRTDKLDRTYRETYHQHHQSRLAQTREFYFALFSPQQLEDLL